MNATTERNLKVHGDERISARTKSVKKLTWEVTKTHYG